METSFTVLTDASPRAVFAALTDVMHWPEFMPGVTAVEMESRGDLKAGDQFFEARRRFGLERSEEIVVETMTPPRRFTLICGRSSLTVTRRDFAIGFTGNETELRVIHSVEARNFFGKLLRPFARVSSPAVEQRLEADLMAIKAEAERRSS